MLLGRLALLIVGLKLFSPFQVRLGFDVEKMVQDAYLKLMFWLLSVKHWKFFVQNNYLGTKNMGLIVF